ncbi:MULTISPECIES: hypothetical protein [unclassified Streptomyces]|uniref:hypothetical protein n=1 Tax=unclassified Streptomyces TaxID=2593676 RepID=UPI002E28ABCD|nr:hypothetical protein [Streptomyces sp. NBC_00342]
MSADIECRATRRGRLWVAHEPKDGVYGSGRTLRLVRESVEDGLALVGVSAKVRITPVTPELEALRAAEDAYTAALDAAVKALARRRATLGDIAEATGAPVARVKRFLAGSEPAAASTAKDDPVPADPTMPRS